VGSGVVPLFRKSAKILGNVGCAMQCNSPMLFPYTRVFDSGSRDPGSTVNRETDESYFRIEIWTEG
jgi:hypothetical protein